MEDGGLILRDRVYDTICSALARGDFAPGQKIKIRSMAAETGTSLTPVREALNRLVAENVLRSEANKSTIVPILSGPEIRELRDIRILNETFATRIAASKITKEQIVELRSISNSLNAARDAGDVPRDLRAINDFQFALYQISAMPLMLKIIRMLWLKSGPYLQVLFPDYIVELKRSRGDWRGRLCDALERADIDAACQEIHSDIHDAMSYVAAVMGAVPGEQKAR